MKISAASLFFYPLPYKTDRDCIRSSLVGGIVPAEREAQEEDHQIRPQIEGSLLRLTANALYAFGLDEQVVAPYIGGGVAVTFDWVDDADLVRNANDVRYEPNVVGGVSFGLGRLRPFVQMSARGLGEYVAAGGVLFSF